jgi:hypothetical protein
MSRAEADTPLVACMSPIGISSDCRECILPLGMPSPDSELPAAGAFMSPFGISEDSLESMSPLGIAPAAAAPSIRFEYLDLVIGTPLLGEHRLSRHRLCPRRRACFRDLSRRCRKRLDLPLVPKRIVGAAYEHLQASICICADRDIASQDSTFRRPAGPARIRRDLPLVPKRAVSSAHESFQSPLGTATERNIARDYAAL